MALMDAKFEGQGQRLCAGGARFSAVLRLFAKIRAGRRAGSRLTLGQRALSASLELAGGIFYARRQTAVAQGYTHMQPTTAGITKANTGIDGIVWNILGQTYVPKQLSEETFAWHATFPPTTFVPPHIHPTQDEFIYMLEGRMDAVLDGKDFVATAGDLIRMPMNVPHGLFNKSDQPVKCLFWVTPTRKLYDLFWAIHSMKEQNPPEVMALAARHEVNFLPPPEGA
jgi:quercetin dioxygenase-like cupin family protein